MALSLPPSLCRHTLLVEFSSECEVSGTTHCPNSQWSVKYVYMAALHINILYTRAEWRFWCLVSLNVSAVPPLHSGFFCMTSPGLNYIFMGQVDEDGRGKIAPHHFVMAFKTKNQKALNVLKSKRCWVPAAPGGARCARRSSTVDGNNQRKTRNGLLCSSAKHKHNLDAEMLAQQKSTWYSELEET